MESHPKIFDVVIVGAGWAGLSVSYLLKQSGFRHLVLERNRICETWRTQRWSSFRMNTPNIMTVLPGDHYEGPAPEGYMTRDAFVEMVEMYATRHDLPVKEHTEVIEVKSSKNGFEIRTPEETVQSRIVVVASGNLNVPRRPTLATKLPDCVNQIDSSDYRNSNQLPPGAVLVIGCGNSGGQIAEDLANSGRKVFLSTGKNGRVPRRYRDRDIFLWLTDTGRLAKPRTTSSGRGLIGATHTISLQSLSAQGITLVGRLRDVSNEGIISVADTLAESASFGDEMSMLLRQEIDDFIASQRLDVPPAKPDPAETVAPIFPDPPISEIDLDAEDISTVIWSTGFCGDFSWLKVTGATDENGNPIQEYSISVPGIYFAGLDTSESLRAGTVLVAKQEAERIVDHIVTNSDVGP